VLAPHIEPFLHDTMRALSQVVNFMVDAVKANFIE